LYDFERAWPLLKQSLGGGHMKSNSRKIKLSALSISTLVFLVGFQNCSKISQSDISSFANQTNNGLSTDELANDSETELHQPLVNEPSIVNNPPVQQPSLQQPSPEREPASVPILNPAPLEDVKCEEWAYEKKEVVEKAANNCHGSNDVSKKDKDKDKKSDDDSDYLKVSNSSKKTEDNKSRPSKCHVKEDDEVSDGDFESYCSMTENQLRANNIIAQALNYLHLRGISVINPQIAGTDRIDKVEDVRGHLILCGMTVNKIYNTRGKVSLIDSTVKKIHNHRGIVILNNTIVDSCTDIRGVISVNGSRSVCQIIEESKGIVLVKR
jgi:hypothetical protein